MNFKNHAAFWDVFDLPYNPLTPHIFGPFLMQDQILPQALEMEKNVNMWDVGGDEFK